MKRKRILWWFLAATAACGIFAGLILLKKIRITPFFAKRYALKGVDVSHHQGKIDWAEFGKQDVKFAFIKATEGSSYADEEFSANRKAAGECGIRTGAYHFFSFDSPGNSQAENFIAVVGGLSGEMIPAVDVEYYGNKEADPPEKDAVIRELGTFLAALEEEYGVKPMIYTTYPVYYRYIRGAFEDYPLWIRNVYVPPVDIGKRWQFWQYSDTGRFAGVSGRESYVDMNAFRGDEEEFCRFLVP